MRLFKKINIVFISLLFVMMSSMIGIFAIEGESSCPYPNVQKIIGLKEGITLEIDGTENKLFWEFEDYDQAFQIICIKENELLVTMKEKNNLLPLTKDNWTEYEAVFNEMYPGVYNGNNTNIDLLVLSEFFTICENIMFNETAINIYNTSNYDVRELIAYLPYTSPIIEKVRENTPTTYGTYYVNIGNMVSYAKKYATTRNPSYEYFSQGNCANFVSQVLKAGGMSTDQVWKPYSASWNAAHNFVNYWYSRCYSPYSTIYYSSFYNNVKTGDILSIDNENDGRWDHMGFNANGSGSNFTLAQNSDNYYGSISGRPGWSKAKRFMRIRFAS